MTWFALLAGMAIGAALLVVALIASTINWKG